MFGYILAFWFGGLFGVSTMAIMNAAKDSDNERTDGKD